MPSTRSAAQRQQVEGVRLDETDYFGPPPPTGRKRHKSAQETSDPNLNSPAGLARNSNAMLQQAQVHQSSGVLTPRKTRQTSVDQDNYNEPVNIPFNKVVSASNAARVGHRRTVNGLGSEDSQIEPDTADAEPDRETYHLEDVLENVVTKPSARRRGRPPKAEQSRKRKRETRPEAQSQDDENESGSDLCDLGKASSRKPQAQRKAAAQSKTTSANVAFSEGQGRQQSQRQPEKTTPVQGDEEEHETSGYEDAEDGDLTNEAVEDSAFIESPQSNETLVKVTITIPSLRGIFETLRHAAWTGKRDWDTGTVTACKSASGRTLWNYAMKLKDILVDSLDARNRADEDDIYGLTIQYLRDKATDLKKLFKDIDKVVERICTEEMADGESLAGHAVKARKRLLRDMAKRIIPMFVLVIDKACAIGLSKRSKSWLTLQLNSFTLQFLLRAVGWTTRLVRSLARGLESWSIDKEFGKDEEELEPDEATLKDSKVHKRQYFQEQLGKLENAAKKAEREIQEQAKQAARQIQEEKLKRQKMIRQRELRDQRQRKEYEEEEKSLEQLKVACRFTQALKRAPDPFKKKMDWYNRRLSRPQAAEAEERFTVPNNRLPVVHTADHDDPFDDDDDPVSTSAVHQRHTEGYRGAPNGHSARAPRQGGAWNGPDWDSEEEKILVNSLKYKKDYNMVSMAQRLGRTEEDVARKVALIKAACRLIFDEEGRQLPSWAI